MQAEFNLRSNGKSRQLRQASQYDCPDPKPIRREVSDN
jgi:hypothetical protein